MSARALEPSAEPAGGELARIYRDHADFVWRAVQRFGIPEAQAEDVVHEVFLVVQRRIEDFRPRAGEAGGPGETPRAWLWGIARGVASNVRRGRERATRREQVSLEVVPPSQPDTPEEQLRRAQAAALVERFLAELPDDKRVVFELCEIEGLSGPEVAQALELDVNRVYTCLRVARKHFRAYLDQLESESP
ncbi:RNA polymerase sigma factor [Nannocystaceae bacterium ST9]